MTTNYKTKEHICAYAKHMASVMNLEDLEVSNYENPDTIVLFKIKGAPEDFCYITTYDLLNAETNFGEKLDKVFSL